MTDEAPASLAHALTGTRIAEQTLNRYAMGRWLSESGIIPNHSVANKVAQHIRVGLPSAGTQRRGDRIVPMRQKLISFNELAQRPNYVSYELRRTELVNGSIDFGMQKPETRDAERENYYSFAPLGPVGTITHENKSYDLSPGVPSDLDAIPFHRSNRFGPWKSFLELLAQYAREGWQVNVQAGAVYGREPKFISAAELKSRSDGSPKPLLSHVPLPTSTWMIAALVPHEGKLAHHAKILAIRVPNVSASDSEKDLNLGESFIPYLVVPDEIAELTGLNVLSNFSAERSAAYRSAKDIELLHGREVELQTRTRGRAPETESGAHFVRPHRPPAELEDEGLVASAAQEDKIRTIQRQANNASRRRIDLVLGLPSYAPDSPYDQLVTRRDAVFSLNKSSHTVNWTMWRTQQSDLSKSSNASAQGATSGGRRVRDASFMNAEVKRFRPDPLAPPGWRHVDSTALRGTGFNTGHLVPAADRAGNIRDYKRTYLSTNAVIQAKHSNMGPWEAFEAYLRSYASEGWEILNIAGPIFERGSSLTTLKGVAIPDALWKVALLIPPVEEGSTQALSFAIEVPNVNSEVPMLGSFSKYLVTPAAIEERTGLKFFTHLAKEEADRFRMRSSELRLKGRRIMPTQAYIQRNIDSP